MREMVASSMSARSQRDLIACRVATLMRMVNFSFRSGLCGFMKKTIA